MNIMVYDRFRYLWNVHTALRTVMLIIITLENQRMKYGAGCFPNNSSRITIFLIKD